MYTRVTGESAIDSVIFSNATKTQSRHKESSGAQSSSRSADTFEHSTSTSSPFTDYTATGAYAQETKSILPDRYYDGVGRGKVFYKGGSVTYIELLEEAVQSGEVVLDETKSVWHNVHAAEKALIDDKARTLFPWSKALYSEDGQYKFRVEGGVITGATATFTTYNGKRISIFDIAKQIADGKPISEIEGDTGFLMRLDPELYDAANALGNAKRVYAQQTEWYQNGEITEKRYISELEPADDSALWKESGQGGSCDAETAVCGSGLCRQRTDELWNTGLKVD